MKNYLLNLLLIFVMLLGLGLPLPAGEFKRVLGSGKVRGTLTGTFKEQTTSGLEKFDTSVKIGVEAFKVVKATLAKAQAALELTRRDRMNVKAKLEIVGKTIANINEDVPLGNKTLASAPVTTSFEIQRMSVSIGPVKVGVGVRAYAEARGVGGVNIGYGTGANAQRIMKITADYGPAASAGLSGELSGGFSVIVASVKVSIGGNVQVANAGISGRLAVDREKRNLAVSLDATHSGVSGSISLSAKLKLLWWNVKTWSTTLYSWGSDTVKRAELIKPKLVRW